MSFDQLLNPLNRNPEPVQSLMLDPQNPQQQENDYLGEYNGIYMDAQYYCCEQTQTEVMKEKKTDNSKHQSNLENMQNEQPPQISSQVTAIQTSHKDLILKLETFSNISLLIDGMSSPLKFFQIDSYVSKIPNILSKFFQQDLSVIKILEKFHSKHQKEILEKIIFQNVTWFVWMVTKFEGLDLEHNRFYKLFNELYSKFSQSARIVNKIKQWKDIFIKRFLMSKTLRIKLIEPQNQSQRFQNTQDQVEELDFLVKVYFTQKIQPNINYHSCYQTQDKQLNLGKFILKILNSKDQYIKMSQKHLQSLHTQFYTLEKNQNELFQIVWNYFEARTSQLVIEHIFGPFIQKSQNHSNIINDKSALTTYIDKLENQIHLKIFAWSKQRLPQLLKNFLQSSKLESKSISIIWNSLVQDFLKFWSGHKNCQICCKTYQSYKIMTAFECHHEFCHFCLNQYVNHQLQSFKLAKCPLEECRKPMDKDSQFYQLMPIKNFKKERHIEKYMLVLNNDFLKLCPTQDCSGLIAVIKGETIVCQICHNVFCEDCLMPIHDGDCEYRQVQYLKQNYMYIRCSRCLFVLEKLDGCNNMTCRCGNMFCYSCGAKWHMGKSCQEIKDVKNDMLSYHSTQYINVNQQNLTLLNMQEQSQWFMQRPSQSPETLFETMRQSLQIERRYNEMRLLEANSNYAGSKLSLKSSDKKKSKEKLQKTTKVPSRTKFVKKTNKVCKKRKEKPSVLQNKGDSGEGADNLGQNSGEQVKSICLSYQGEQKIEVVRKGIEGSQIEEQQKRCDKDQMIQEFEEGNQ